jgi:murein DD-endopeptidase MepM/ murein hydrolase activator NlpD
MKHTHKIPILAAVLTLLLVSLACAFAGDLLAEDPSFAESTQAANEQPAATPLETQPPDAPDEQREPDAPPEPEPALTPEQSEQPAEPEDATASPACAEEVCVYTTAFRLQRPVGTSGRNTIDPTLRFGTYLRSLKNAYHGVSFINSSGTPVVAAADGEVVFAGDDSQVPHAQYKNYYGNLIILEHRLNGLDLPVHSLYGHLSEILVERGETVAAGQEIGRVGNSGDISGSALHFEVRYGENQYGATRNPELWLQALPDESGAPTGALAGRVVTADGRYVPLDNIVIERLGGAGQGALQTFYLKTYAEDRLKGAEPWQESFALAGLPAGEYQVTFYYGPDLVQREVSVEPERLTVVTIPVP